MEDHADLMRQVKGHPIETRIAFVHGNGIFLGKIYQINTMDCAILWVQVN